MTFLNPDIGSGLFTLNGVTIFDGDTYTDVVSRVVTHCRSLALNSKGKSFLNFIIWIIQIRDFS